MSQQNMDVYAIARDAAVRQIQEEEDAKFLAIMEEIEAQRDPKFVSLAEELKLLGDGVHGVPAP